VGHRRGSTAALALALTLAAIAAGVVSPAGAATVAPYAANDYGGAGVAPGAGFHSILPAGTNGLVTLPQLIAYEANSANKPPHNDDQLAMYRDLVYGAPGLTDAQIPQYYKDATFGVPSFNVDSARTVTFTSPPVTIIRDKPFGVPHVYGDTRPGVMFGAGYAAAQDRLFFMDVLRHAGRSQLASFAGGANAGMDQSTFQIDPYTDQDLTNQVDALPQEYGAQGQQVRDDVTNYVAGVNEYINEAKLNPLMMPGEYSALGHPLGPDPWTTGDVVAVANVIGGILGTGGGDQLDWAKILEAMQQRFGAKAGSAAYLDFRSPEDPEAPVTARTGLFPYMAPPRHPAADAVALPDGGSLKPEPITTAGATSPGGSTLSHRSGTRATGGIFGASSIKQAFPQGMSNALLLSAAHSASGHPLAVFGPQVGYFAPQVLMDEDLHGPGIDAAGAGVTGANMYVELGHGRDYAWSATSAGQGTTDVFAVPLCNTDGSAATTSSSAYISNGQCTPMTTITRSESWAPNLADSTAAGSQTLVAQRTAFGIVNARATVRGQPVAFTLQRATFMHDVDSAIGFEQFNDPGAVHDVQSFQHAAYQIGYTFNWLYADDRDIGYFNSGSNPVRNPNTDGLLPAPSKYEWQGFNGSTNTASYTPFQQHPQVVNQDFITSWNNKQGRGYRAVDGFYTPIYRSQLLDDRIRAGIAGGRKMTLAQLISAMEDAGTVDLRGDKVLPWILRVIARQPLSDPRLAGAVGELTAWMNDGSHRRDLTNSGTYAHSDAIRIMDAWWPLLVKAEFEPVLGADAYKLLTSKITIDNDPNNGGQHLGSAYDNGWYGFVQKDLRDLLAGRGITRSVCHTESRRVRVGRRIVSRRVRTCKAFLASAAAHDAATKRPRAQRRHKPRPVPAVLGPYSRVYCGNGSLTACRTMLLSTLSQALGATPQQLYADASCAAAGRQYSQECYDAVGYRAVGVVAQPLQPWINRPTFQQAVDIFGHRPR